MYPPSCSRTGRRADGCATFWLRSKFDCVGEHRLLHEHNDLADNIVLYLLLKPLGPPESSGPSRPSPASRQPTAQQTASIPAASSTPPPPDCLVLVANTHVIFDPARGDAKVGQVRMLMETAAQLMASMPQQVLPLIAGEAARSWHGLLYSLGYLAWCFVALNWDNAHVICFMGSSIHCIDPIPSSFSIINCVAYHCAAVSFAPRTLRKKDSLP